MARHFTGSQIQQMLQAGKIMYLHDWTGNQLFPNGYCMYLLGSLSQNPGSQLSFCGQRIRKIDCKALPWPDYFAGGPKSFGKFKLSEFCHHILGHVFSL